MYNWSDYNFRTYKYIKDSDEKANNNLIIEYQKIIDSYESNSNWRFYRTIPPPGIYADLGYLYIENGLLSEGKTLLLKEIENYPESKVFLQRLINELDQWNIFSFRY